MNTQPLPLADIITPEAIHWWPLAWGWWVLFAVVGGALAAILVVAYKCYQQQQKQQQALALLTSSTTALNGQALYSAVNTWLKIQARPAYPQALSLHGSAWVEFLNHSAGSRLFSDDAARALSEGVYRPLELELSATELQHLAQQWLKLSKALNGGRDV